MNDSIFRNNWERVGRLVPSLGRDNSHEVLAAVHAIGAALKSGGLDWHDMAREVEAIGVRPAVCTPPFAASASAAETSCRSWSAKHPTSFGDMARACRDLDRGRLELREKQFVSDMCRRGFGFRPSPRQSSWLTAIFDRLNERAAA